MMHLQVVSDFEKGYNVGGLTSNNGDLALDALESTVGDLKTSHAEESWLAIKLCR